MRKLLWMSSVLVLTIAAAAQQSGRVRAGEVPPQPLHGTVDVIYDSGPVRNFSFKYICDRSDLIVEGLVETSEGRQMGTWPNSHIETDLWISVARVLKGPDKLSKLVVSEKGGVLGDYREHVMYRRAMQPGERYILFLQSDGRSGLSQIPGLSRYFVSGGWEEGKYLISGGKIQPVAKETFDARYDGMSLDDFAAEIRAQLR